MVHSWLAANRSKGELRNFARALVPRSLYGALVTDRAAKRLLTFVLPERRKQVTSEIKDACSHRQQRPVTDPLSPRLSADNFFDFKGPYSTSDKPAARRVHLCRPPPSSAWTHHSPPQQVKTPCTPTSHNTH